MERSDLSSDGEEINTKGRCLRLAPRDEKKLINNNMPQSGFFSLLNYIDSSACARVTHKHTDTIVRGHQYQCVLCKQNKQNCSRPHDGKVLANNKYPH